MAVHTILLKKEIVQFLKDYDIGNLKGFEGIKQGIENTNYLIKTTKNKYILTIFEKRIKRSELPFFIELMDFSNKNNISCPVSIKNSFQKNLVSLKSKKCALFTFIEGKCLENWSDIICYKIGQILGDFHNVNKKFKKKNKNHFDLQGWKKLFEKCASGINKLIPNTKDEIYNELIYLSNNWPQKLPKGIIHADFFPDNILFKNSEVTGILDFYFSCYDFFIYDIAIAINAWCFKNNKMKLSRIKHLLTGYKSKRKISIHEMQALNICLRGASMRFLLTRIHDSLFVKKNFLYTLKNPKEYYDKLIFHTLNIKNKEYFD